MKTVVEVRRQLSDLCRKLHFELRSAGDNTERVRECLAKGLFCNVAALQRKGFYKTVSGLFLSFCNYHPLNFSVFFHNLSKAATTEEVHIHPSSCLHSLKPDHVVYTELTQTSKCYIRFVQLLRFNCSGCKQKRTIFEFITFLVINNFFVSIFDVRHVSVIKPEWIAAANLI
jgi:hypothetical protein